MQEKVDNIVKTAMQAGLKTCLECGGSVDGNEDTCKVCYSEVSYRKPKGIEKTIAYLVTALALFIPANLLPTTKAISVLGEQSDTILSGVIFLWIAGDKPIALVVFIASFVTPMFKFISIIYLCYTCKKGSTKNLKFKTKLYHVNELIGRWSMIDVFVVALLGAMVKMGSLATIEPQLGIVAFALVVFFTMKSMHHFDPRLIWDGVQKDQTSSLSNRH